jgi:hypothetical protein
VSYKWEKISGNGILSTPDQMVTKVIGLTKGEQFFKLTITDNNGTGAFEDVKSWFSKPIYCNIKSFITAVLWKTIAFL